MRSARRSVIVVAATALALGLGGCSAHDVASPSPTQTTWTVQPAPASTDGATAAAAGTAAENKAAFDRTITSVLGASQKATGQTVTTALEAAGFAKATLQYSASKTSANLVPGSITVSAQLGSSCLIGQWGSAVGGYHSAIVPALGSGGCLVGSPTASPAAGTPAD